MTREDIFVKVRQSISHVLDFDINEIKETSKLVDELGADSLDLLDLIFHLEQEFNLKLSPRDFENRAKREMGDAPFEIEGVYTNAAMERIRAGMPEVPREELPDGLSVQDLPRRFRVATIVNLVERAIEENKHG